MACTLARPPSDEVFITEALAARPQKRANYRREKEALHQLATRMAEDPADLLDRFVDLAMSATGAISAGLSLYDADTAPEVFRWCHLRGMLERFEGATAPRTNSPCGVTLDQNTPVLVAHPERLYDWIADHGLNLAEVLLIPLFVGGAEQLGTLWMVSDAKGHFDSGDVRVASELASFVGIALRMIQGAERLRGTLDEQETIAREMSHRLKNVFAMTDGMIRASAKNAKTPEELAQALSGRLHALASAHSLVRRRVSGLGSVSETTDLGDLILAVVKAHERPNGEGASRFRIRGGPVSCGAHSTNGVALVIHELATNAAKYGALQQKDGMVEIHWHVLGEKLLLNWEEGGGPSVPGKPTTQGFGTTLVRRIVTGQFRGTLERDWRPGGLVVSMTLALARIAN